MATMGQTEDSTASNMQSLLTEILAVLGDELDFVGAIRRLLDALTSAFACHSALYYLFDEQKGRLVLVCASQSYAHLEDSAELALGESAIVLAAQRREPVLEQGASSGGNRSLSSTGEDPFPSQLAIPLIAKDGSLMGVLALHAVAPKVLSERYQALSLQIAHVVVGVVEQIRRNEQAARWRERLARLSELSHLTSSGPELGVDELVQRIAALAVQLLGCDLVVILLFQQNSGQLVVAGVFPQVNRRTLPRRPIPFEQQDWIGLSEQGAVSLERFNPLRDTTYHSLLSAPLMVGSEFLGMFNCYTQAARSATAEEKTLLQTIASQTAVAIKLSLLSDVLARKQEAEEIIAELMEGTYEEQALRQRASVLGLDLARPHVVVLIDLVSPHATPDDQSQDDASGTGEQAGLEEAGHNRIRSGLRRRLRQLFPASLIAGQANRLTCLLNVSGSPSSAQLTSGLRELVQQVRGTYQQHVFMGVSTPCFHLAEYRRGFLESSEALHMGQSRNREGGVTHFNDLGVYRYLYKMAQIAQGDEISDQYQHIVSMLADYDRKKGAELLDTLETWLENAGNLTETSRRLVIHRNTLIQRLERMRTMSELDLDDRKHWLALQVAIKLFKLQS